MSYGENPFDDPPEPTPPPVGYWETTKADESEVLEAEIVESSAIDAYGVPQRFGLLALLALMAVFSVVFAVCRFLNAPAPVYLFLGCMATVTGIAQMRFGSVPRVASISSGAIFLPVFWVGTVGILKRIDPSNAFNNGPDIIELVFATPCMAVGGAFLGYLIGTVVAGVFLLANMWEERSRKDKGNIEPQEFSAPLRGHS